MIDSYHLKNDWDKISTKAKVIDGDDKAQAFYTWGALRL